MAKGTATTNERIFYILQAPVGGVIGHNHPFFNSVKMDTKSMEANVNVQLLCVYMLACLSVCIQCMQVYMCHLGSCTVLHKEDCSLLRAVHQRVFKVMDEPLLQRSVGKTEKQSHWITTATISQMV